MTAFRLAFALGVILLWAVVLVFLITAVAQISVNRTVITDSCSLHHHHRGGSCLKGDE